MSLLDENQVANIVRKMPPGDYLRFDFFQLRLPKIDLDVFGIRGNFADRVLGKIIGSAYEWFYVEEVVFDSSFPGYTFYRLPQPYPVDSNLWASVSPDRKDHFEGIPGKYKLKGKSTWYDQSKIDAKDRIYYAIEDIERDFCKGLRPGSQVLVPHWEPIALPIDCGIARNAPMAMTRAYVIREFWQCRREVNYYKLVAN
jgi:hypothetical protein